MFKKNVGTIDRVFRVVLGIAMIGAGVFYSNWWGAIGLLPLTTGIIGSCGLYTLLGISSACSCKEKGCCK